MIPLPRDFRADSSNQTNSTSSNSVKKAALDLNSEEFDAEHYVQDLLHKRGLEELVAVEQDMVNNVRRLDSEMQSLVYENYSKFLNATSTVRDMQTRLADTQDKMRDIFTRVERITDLSDTLTEKFAKNCEKVKKLNEAKNSVKRLEFLIKAPQILQNYIEQAQMAKAVDAYVMIRPKLDKFSDIPSIAGISRDVERIMEGAKSQKFRETLDRRLISSDEVVEAVTLLKKLGITEQELEKQLLTTWEREIWAELDQLEANANPEKGRFPDIFEFVDTGCCHFLTNLSLMASTFLQLYPKQQSKAELVHLLERAMVRFEAIAERRFEIEQNAAECALFVKALDRIYRKISVLARLSSGFNFMRMNVAMIQRCAKHQIMVCRQSTVDTVKTTIAEVLSKLSHSPPIQSSSKSDTGARPAASSTNTGIRHDRKELMKKQLEKLERAFVQSVKSSLAALLMFTASDCIFSTIPHFSPLFGLDVHEKIVVGPVQDLIAEIRSITGGFEWAEGNSNNAVMAQESDGGKGTDVLVLCTFLRNLQLKHLDYLMELCREQYRLSEYHLVEQHKLTEGSELAEELKEAVRMLLRRFVEVESGTFVQMVRKSIDLFDWAACSESPRRVRTLIKHLVHSVDEIDTDLAVFMDDGGLVKINKERTPDSLRGSYSTMRRAASAASSVYNDASSVSSGGIVERLWGDAGDGMEENSTTATVVETSATVPVEFRRDVLVNAIVRLMLRAMSDFIRSQKFSRQGLEQMQVDCAFMRQKLWTSVGDEHMLNMLIEDVLTTAVNQCAQPKLLDPSVVRSICEEN